MDYVIRFHSKLGRKNLKVIVFPVDIAQQPYETNIKIKEGEH